MKNGRFFLSPFKLLGASVNVEILGIETWHETPYSTAGSLQEGVLAMISKLIRITRELSQCVRTCSTPTFDMCEHLAKDVRVQEKVLTRLVDSSEASPDLRIALIHFPNCLEKVADMMERVLKCCRIKAKDGIAFSYTACAELDELFALLLEMMSNLRVAFIQPHTLLLESIVCDGKRLGLKLDDNRKSHWRRLKASVCAHEASTMYEDILDSLMSVNECLIKMSSILLEFGRDISIPANCGEAAKTSSGEAYREGY